MLASASWTFSQYLLHIDGFLSNTNGVAINVLIAVNPNSTAPIILKSLTDSTGYFYDTVSVSTTSGTVAVTIIDCRSDTLTQIGSFQSNPTGRLSVFVKFDYCASLTCKAKFVKSQAYDNVTRKPIPFAVQITDSSVGTGLTYFWDFGDGSTYSGKNTTHTYTSPGPYLLCLTVSKPSCLDTFCDLVSVDSLGNVKSGAGFTLYVGDGKAMGSEERLWHPSVVDIYPNPAINDLNLNIRSDSREIAYLSIFSPLGSLVYREAVQLNTGKETHRIDISGLKSGLYILKLESGNINEVLNFKKE